jgi:hypothetical protein
MVAGFAVFLLNGGGLLRAYPTVPIVLLSIGTFFFGMGEWINHPLKTVLMEGNAYRPGGVLTGHPRRAGLAGTLFDMLGIGLIGFGVWRLIRGA